MLLSLIGMLLQKTSTPISLDSQVLFPPPHLPSLYLKSKRQAQDEKGRQPCAPTSRSLPGDLRGRPSVHALLVFIWSRRPGRGRASSSGTLASRGGPGRKVSPWGGRPGRRQGWLAGWLLPSACTQPALAGTALRVIQTDFPKARFSVTVTITVHCPGLQD